MTNTYQADFIIVGGGVAGMATACLLARYDFKVICIDREDPYTQASENYDRRAIAVSYGSSHVFKACGAWDAIVKNGCPIEHIDILDDASPILLAFEKEQSPEGAFGWIVEMYHLRQGLLDIMQDDKRITHLTGVSVDEFFSDENCARVTLSNGELCEGALIVGADGRGSSTRKWLGISTHQWSYNQRAIVCAVAHENPHEHIAVEHFKSVGPFAVLPMNDNENGQHRSSIVWTEHCTEDVSATALSDEAFAAALQENFPNRYGQVSVCSQVFSYPLGLIHAHRYYGQRCVLVADAAHGIHPVAGQGLNLGLRDVAALAEVMVEARLNDRDLGEEALLKRYQRMRHFDNMAMAATCDGLVKLFSNRSRIIGTARRIGLRITQKMPRAKRFFAKQAMGTSGLLPKLVRGEELG